ncbi:MULTISPECIES: CHAT domain-containing protein [Natrialbaceae]|uniref:hypothetical protein n=1 Tax=Natrialbaceae TaxID=1644061 RepID=UPI0031F2DAF9
MIVEVRPDQQTSLPKGEYILDLSGPLKLYAQVHGSVQIYSDPQRTHIIFGKSSPVIIGARSYHTRPARTITTTSNPEDIMQVVSMFGSALKTTTPDRSFPTLRGHPPAIEKGDELVIPEGLKKPKTGIQFEVPPTLQHIFVIMPLAYYFGAEVVSGSEPQLTTDTGYSYALDGEDGFESTVNRILKHTFFLDCVVRTEGISPLPLHKRSTIKSILEFDIESAYEKSISEQLEIYLGVPFSTIEPHLPDWRLEIQLEPKSDYVEFLPFLANYLPVINIQEDNKKNFPEYEDQVQAISEFMRNDFTREMTSVRSNDSIPEQTDEPISLSVKQLWTGENTPEIISTTPLSAFQNSIGRNPREDPIEIKVICNDLEMREELESVDDAYGNREELPFDVVLHHNITTSEFKDILSNESDFLHYIGHIDKSGFQCSDGRLDASTVEKSNIKAFLLNACQSHDQGLHLIEAGSIGGIVTLGNVINSGAVRIGSTIAQLLNQGFPLYGALDIAQNESIVSQQYLMVGDGRTTIAQSETAVPNACLIKKGMGEMLAEIKTYDSIRAERGTLFTPYLDPIDSYYIVPGKTEQIPVQRSHLEEFFDKGRFPVVIDGSVRWSNNLENDDLI